MILPIGKRDAVTDFAPAGTDLTPARILVFANGSDFIMYPLPLKNKLKQCHSQDEQKEHRRYRGGIAHLVISKAILIDVKHERRGIDSRSSKRQDVDLVKDLKRADERQHQAKEQRRREQGNGDMPEALPTRRAIDRGRFVEMLRDIL